MTAVDFAEFVGRLADASGEVIAPFFRTALHAADKSGGGMFDPVTEADRAAESVMRRMIEAQFPDHGIVGEEFGARNSGAEYVWVLDPIDGTKSFIGGMPLWGTLIGLLHHQRPAYGMMHQPFTRERFQGDGGAAFWERRENGRPTTRRPLRTRACATLGEATLMTTHPALLKDGALGRFERVERAVRLSRYGGDCYSVCMVACGHVDLVIESGLQPYDIVALIPIVQGAGGLITTWDGGDAARGGAIVAAGDPRAHEAALRLLNA